MGVMMFRVVALLLGLSSAAFAQIPGVSNAPGAAAAETAADPLGRETPGGTVLGFNRAVRRGDLFTAKQYMQITDAQADSADSVARQLNELIDRYFAQAMSALSSSRTGIANDGLPLDRDRVELTVDGRSHDVILVRVSDPQGGLLWLISSDSLAQVPALYATAQVPWFERIMPGTLLRTRVAGISLGRLLAYLVTVVVPFAALWLLSTALITIARKTVTDPARRKALELWYAGLRGLVVFVLALLIHLGLIRYLAFTLRFRYVYSRLAIAACVIAAAWLLARFLALSIGQARIVAQRRGDSGFSSLLMLAQRVGNVMITMVAIFAILSLAGVDTTTALAGVGIGGVAVALGAQKSVENLLGGVFLITDRALAVGDECRIADRQGRVEDITLRSVRLRTIEQTLLCIPAGALSQASIENFTTRGKIPVQTKLRLGYETTAAQLRAVLDGVRRLMVEHPEIESSSSRIRLVDFGPQALELELFAYILTSDALRFLAVREELLLKIAEIVESAGTTFARPTEYLYLGTPSQLAGRREEVRT